MKRLHLIIHGRVQGVFFRRFVKEQGTVLGVTGFVRNKNDGTVEVVAEGNDEALNQMIEKCRHGPAAARVDKIEKKEDERYTGEWNSFERV